MSLTKLLIVSIFAVIGLVYLKHGKQTSRMAMVLCGFGLLIFPYFISSLLYSIIAGVCISLVPLFIKA